MAPEAKSEEQAVELDSSKVPKLLSMKTAAFRTKYHEWVAFHDEILPPDVKQKSRRMDRGPEQHADFIALLNEAPELHQHLVAELTTMLREFEKDDDIVNRDPLWPQQKALLIEFIQMIVQKHYTGAELMDWLLEAAPGSGKTRILGIVIAALSRMMVRGVLEGNVLISIKRKTMVMMQALSKWEMRSTLMSRELSKMRSREISEQRRYAKQEMRGSDIDFFPPDVWETLCHDTYEHMGADEAIRWLQASLDERGLREEFERYPHHERVLSELSHCIAREGAIIAAPYERDLEFIELSAPEDVEEDAAKGDLLFGVEQQLIDNGCVYIQTDFTYGDEEMSRLPTERTRIAVMSQMSTTHGAVQKNMSPFLSNLKFRILDEAGGNNPDTLGSLGMPHGAKKVPVLAATAYKESDYWTGDFSYFSVEDGVNSDPQVLKPPRLRVFPGNEGVRFPSGSYQAGWQLMQALGDKLDLPDARGVSQLTEDGALLIVVDRPLVPDFVQMMRMQYAGTGVRIISYNANSGKEQHAGRTQLRMNDPEYTDTILVGSMDRVADSFDFRQLRGTIMGIKPSKQAMKFLERLFGRQWHSLLENGYIVQQLFSNMKERNYLAWLAYDLDCDLPTEGPMELHPGQHIIGKRECDREKRWLKKKNLKPQKVWASATQAEFETHVRRTEEGTFPPKLSDNPRMEQSYVIEFPQVAAKVPSRQNAVGAPYVKKFAEVNGLQGFERELLACAKKAGEGMAERAEALRQAALELKLQSLVTIAANAETDVRQATKKIKAKSLSRDKWVDGQADKKAVKTAKEVAKKEAAKKQKSNGSKKKKKASTRYAENVMNRLGFSEQTTSTSVETFAFGDAETVEEEMFVDAASGSDYADNVMGDDDARFDYAEPDDDDFY